jgi:hypothetical protein
MYVILNDLNALRAYGCTCLLSQEGYEECPIHSFSKEDLEAFEDIPDWSNSSDATL